MLSSMEGAPMRIIKAPYLPPPAPPPSFSAARPVQGHPSGSSTSPPTASSSEPRTDPPRMATIEEDPSGDSPPGTAFPSSSAAAKSFEDLTEHSPLNRQTKRLQRQACIESKETECWYWSWWPLHPIHTSTLALSTVSMHFGIQQTNEPFVKNQSGDNPILLYCSAGMFSDYSVFLVTCLNLCKL